MTRTMVVERDPTLYGVPHKEWRAAQFEAAQLLTDSLYGDVPYTFAGLPTGSGKSGLATYLGFHDQVLVHVHTLNLLDQYSSAYGFEILKGQQTYYCVLPKKVETWKNKHNRVPMVSDCHFEDKRQCPVYNDCPYIIARNRALASKRTATTYRMGALNKAFQERSGILVMDEVHGVVEELLDLDTVTFTESDREYLQLPDFPFRKNYGTSGKGGEGDLLTNAAKANLLAWVDRCDDLTSGDNVNHDDLEPDESRALANLRGKLIKIRELLEYEVFLEAGPTALYRSRRTKQGVFEERVPGIRIRPMSAIHASQKMLAHKQYALGMSGTIRKPEVLAAELGIPQYNHKLFPHPVPASKRPVYDLGLPKMTWENWNNPRIRKQQEVLIINWIKTLDPSWRGLIAAPSNTKVRMLGEALKKAFPRRVSLEGWGGTDMRTWLDQPQPGEIAIATIQGWGTGIDLYGDLARFVVATGVPFSNPSDPFIRARQNSKSAKDYYWWLAYQAIPQLMGRPMRGEKNPDGTYLYNVGAIADGSATTPFAKMNYPDYFKITPYDWSTQ